MIAVSNSSPLVSLARIGRLNLLASFYKRILIPAEVQHEVTVAGRGLSGAEEVRNANWIEVSPQKSLRTLRWRRHAATSVRASAALFSWPRVSKPMSFCWMSGKPVVLREMPVFPLWDVWEYLRRAPGRASSRICARFT